MPATRLVVIDVSVANSATLIAQLQLDPAVQILTVDATVADPLALISTTLAAGSFQSLDVFSHGSPGSLVLGSVALDATTLASQSAALQSLGAGLQAGGSILLYGCSIAANATGQSFIDALAAATGVGVAASVDTTGAASLGGNWVLEAQSTGSLIGATPLSVANFSGTLAGNAAPLAGDPLGVFGTAQTAGVNSTRPWTVRVGDVTGDGNLDLVTFNDLSSSVSVVAGDGMGGFSAPKVLNIGAGASIALGGALADMNNDGQLDIVSANAASGNVSILTSQGSGNFSVPKVIAVGATQARELDIGDLNGDGWKDIVSTNPANNTVSVLMSDGVGGFRAPSLINVGSTGVPAGTSPYGVKLADVNGDGKLDIVTTNFTSSNVSVITANAQGGFNAPTLFGVGTGAVNPVKLTLADVNGDGKLDIVTANQGSNNVSVLTGNGNGSFNSAQVIGTGMNALDVAVADVNGDGAADILAVSGGGSKAVVITANGAGGFNTPQLLGTGGSNVASIQVVDINGDNRLDIVTANYYSAGVGILTAQGGISRTTEDAPVSVALKGSDVDGTVASFRIATLPAHGTLYLDVGCTQLIDTTTAIAASGNAATIYFKPDLNWSGSTSLAYVAVDNLGTPSASPYAYPVVVTAVNDAPALTGGSATLANGIEGTAFTITKSELLQGWTDVDSASLSVVNPSADHGTAVLNADGSITVTPELNYNGTVNLAYDVIDGQGGSSATMRSFNLAAVNDAPALTGPVANLIVGFEDTAYTISQADLLQGFTDVDAGAVLSVTNLTATNGTLVANSNGTWTFTPATNFNGMVSLAYNVIDGQGSTVAATQSFNLAAVNDAPVAETVLGTFDAARTINPGTSTLGGQFAVDVSLSDVNGDGKLDIVMIDKTVGVSVITNNGAGGWNTPTVYSAGGQSLAKVETGDVNGDGNIDIVTSNWGGTVSVLTGDGTGAFGAAQVYIASAAVSNSTGVALGDVNGDGKADIITANQIGNTASVLIANGTGGFNTAQEINVGALAPNRVAVGDLNGDGKLDIVTTDAGSNAVSVLLGDGLGGFSTPGVFSVGTTASSDIALGDMNSDGILDIVTNNAILTGDGSGNFKLAQTGSLGSNFAALTDVNNDGRLDILGNSAAYIQVFTGTGQTHVTASTSVNVSGAGTTGIAVGDINGDGRIDFVTSNYTAQNVSIVTGKVSSTTGSEDTTVNVTLSGVDADGSIASFRITSLPAHGTLYLNAARTQVIDTSTIITAAGNAATIYFQPDANWNGSTSLKCVATDNMGAVSAAEAPYIINVNAVNDAPVLTGAVATLAAAAEDTPFTITKAELLQGWTDVDSANLSIAAGPTTNHGTAVLNADGSITVTPTANYNGPITLSYKVTDGLLTTAATLSTTLNAVNDASTVNATGTLAYTENQVAAAIAPALTVADIDSTTLTGATVQITANYQSGADVLSFVNQNGITGSWDATTGTLTLSGSATLANYQTALRSVKFNNTSDNPGTASRTVSFQVDDGSAVNNLSTVSIHTVTVAPTNDAPVRTGSIATLASGIEGTAFTITQAELLQGWTDVDSATLSVAANPTSDHGTAVLNADGSVTVTPAANYIGPITLNYSVTDGQISVAASLSSTLAPRNTPPALTGIAATLVDGAEDTTYTINAADLLTGFTDAQGDTLSVVNLTATNGTLTDNGNGTWSFAPAANFNGTVSLAYNVIDGQGGVTPASQSFSVAAVNDLPALTDTAASMVSGTEDTAYTISQADLLKGWTDVDAGAVLSVANLTATNGTLAANANGTWTFTPAANFNGTVSLAFDVIDGQGGSVATTQSFSLAAVNDAPEFTIGPVLPLLATGTEDTAYTLKATDLLVGFTDVEGDTLSVANLTATHGTLTDNGDGTWSFAPATNFNGSVSLSYDVIDGQGGVTAASQSFSVAAVNDAPALTGTAASLAGGTEDTGYTLKAADLLAGFTDVEGNTLSVANLTATHGTLTDNGNGTWSFAPAANFNGSVSLSYDVIDGQGGVTPASQSFSLTAVNDAPQAIVGPVLPLAGGTEDTAYTISQADLLKGWTDVDAGAVLSVANLTATNGTLAANANGTWTFTPAANFNGSVSLSYDVIDGQGGVTPASQSFSVAAVNDAPALTGKATSLAGGTEDTGYTISATDLLAGFTDVEGNSLSVANLSAAHGTLTNNGNGTWSFAPDANFNGSVSLSYNVIDGQGGVTPASQSFSLAAVNDAPVLTGSATVLSAATEGVAYTFTPAQLLAGWTDVDLNTLSVQNFRVDHGTVTANADGSFTLSTGTNVNVPRLSVSYDVIDGQGAVVPAQLNLDLTLVNRAAPQLSSFPALLPFGTEDTAYTVSQAQLLSGWSDLDQDTMTVLSLSASQGSVVDNGDGTFTITPPANFNGPVNLSFQVSDGQGGVTNGTQSYYVFPVNDAPVLSGTAATLAAGTEDTLLSVSAAQLLAGWSDIEGSAVSVQNLSVDHGTVVSSANGVFSIQPAANYNGPLTLSYFVADSQGASTPASLSLTVAAVNDAPALTGPVAVLANGTMDVAFTVTPAQLLTGFSDVDGNTLSVAALSADHGSVVTNADGSFTVTPSALYKGLITLSYSVSDSMGGLTPASLSLNLAAVNHAPVLTGATTLLATGTEDTAYTIRATDLLAGFSDVDGNALAVANLTATNGTLLNNGNGTWTFTPAANFNGAISLGYEVIDGQGGVTAATQSFSLAAVNDAPTVAPAMAVPMADQAQNYAFSLPLSAGLFADIDSPVLTYSATLAGGAALPAWLTIDPATGTLSGTPTGMLADQSFSLVLSASDGQFSVSAPAQSLKVLASGTVNLTALADTYVGNLADQTLNGLAGNDIIDGGAGNDVINGGVGNDTMIGGLGNDTFVVDAAGDVVTELLGQGTDTVQASLTYTLPANVENLTLTGTAAINGTGNADANTITGNAGANVLNGGLGADTMIGGAGNDTYVVDNAGDVITEALKAGTDIVQASISFTLPANVETLTFTGTAAVNGNGNALANTLTGNAAVNVLSGGLGKDTLTGGAGNDQFVFNTAAATTNVDTIKDFTGGGIAGGDVLVFDTAVFTALGSGVQTLRAGKGFTTAATLTDHLIFNTTTKALYYDADGSGAASKPVQIATLTGVTALNLADVFIGNSTLAATNPAFGHIDAATGLLMV